MHGALDSSWEGPYKFKEKLPKVNYRTDLEGKRPKVVHINHTPQVGPSEIYLCSSKGGRANESEKVYSI